jgi:hypothetical protein
MYLEDGGVLVIWQKNIILSVRRCIIGKRLYKEHWRERTIRHVPFEYKDCRLEIIRGAGLNSCFF